MLANNMLVKTTKLLFKNELGRIISGLAVFVFALIFSSLKLELVSIPLYVLALLVSGYTVFTDAVRGIRRRDFLDEKFLMSIASIGAMLIGEYSEGVAVMLFFLVGEYFEHKAVRRSRNSIKSLMDICPDTATAVVDGVPSEEYAEDVEIGTLILVRPGERVPIDCEIVDGECELDTSALTGESVPIHAKIGSVINSGTIVLGGTVYARTVCTYENSSASRILALVETAQERKSREEKFISTFSRYYTPIVTLLAILMALIPPIFKIFTLEESVYKALSFLVVSCPCALVISVPMAFFGGIGAAASSGILYKGANTFSAISDARNIVFDKTGTLTSGKFTVKEISAVGVSQEELLYLVSSAEGGSNHPLAKSLSILSASPSMPISTKELVGRGIISVLAEGEIAVGNRTLMSEIGAQIAENDEIGKLYVTKDGVYIGSITLIDEIKPEAITAIERLKRLGVNNTYILSGDREGACNYVGNKLGISHIEHSLLPDDKYRRLEEIISVSTGKTVYVGDGINDAPCLARADVGVAMGGTGSDSAIEAADAVIMSDNLMRLTDMILIARKTLRISKQNIVFAIGIKISVMILVSLSVVGMWAAVFADVGVAVLAILNSMRMLLHMRKK